MLISRNPQQIQMRPNVNQWSSPRGPESLDRLLGRHLSLPSSFGQSVEVRSLGVNSGSFQRTSGSFNQGMWFYNHNDPKHIQNEKTLTDMLEVIQNLTRENNRLVGTINWMKSATKNSWRRFNRQVIKLKDQLKECQEKLECKAMVLDKTREVLDSLQGHESCNSTQAGIKEEKLALNAEIYIRRDLFDDLGSKERVLCNSRGVLTNPEGQTNPEDQGDQSTQEG